MNEIQRGLFELLVEIDEICKANDIEYYLAGGAALGALRCGGFLPWDDDIDLFITRKNWRKLYDLINDNDDILPDDRDLVCMEDSELYRNPIARYVDTSTTVIHAAQSIASESCGQQVEFFILDPIPNEENERKEYLKHMKAFLELVSPNFLTSKFIPLSKYGDHRDLVLSYYKEIEEQGYSAVIDRLYEKYYNYPQEKADLFYLSWGEDYLFYKTEWFSQERLIEFEGKTFPVPNGLEHLYRVEFGDDWVYVPDKSNQMFHNPLIKDLNRSFEEYSDIYLNFINQRKMIKIYEEIKKIYLNIRIPTLKNSLERFKIRGVIATEELYKKIEFNNYDLEKLLNDGEYELLDELFDDYYTVQLKKNCRLFNLFIDLDEEVLKVAIVNKIKQGRYFTALTILNIMENNMDLGEDFGFYKQVCDYCKDLSVNIYDEKDFDKAADILNGANDYCNSLIDTYRAKLLVKLHNSNSDEDYKQVIAEGNDMLIDFPEDGEILASIAEAYYHLGDDKKAHDIYSDAVNHTRNGFVWRDAKQYVGIDKMMEENQC
ncbi:LicD family protein [Methanobrevibacter sp.]|uniref:LicD family protein n=1 Tax=Methanobrevibacter sp. TaxID=66852 RepID=UPI003867EEF4